MITQYLAWPGQERALEHAQGKMVKRTRFIPIYVPRPFVLWKFWSWFDFDVRFREVTDEHFDSESSEWVPVKDNDARTHNDQ